MKHLLVTNDFPPKVGGIQNYLWELWRRLPAGQATVLTTSHPDAAAFDAEQEFEVKRAGRMLLPSPSLVRRIKAEAAASGAELVVLDPALPLGLLAGQLGLPYAVVVHGAEIAVPRGCPARVRRLRDPARRASSSSPRATTSQAKRQSLRRAFVSWPSLPGSTRSDLRP